MTTTAPQPASVSVTLPVAQAIDRVKRVLFQPFDLGKWFAIGFCAWLATLGEGGWGGFHFNFPSGHRHGNARHAVEDAWRYVLNNLHWIVPVVAVVVLLGVALCVVITWLSSRGQFMFLHCVALDKAEVQAPWHKFERQGNSLFGFRLVLGLIGAALILPLVALVVILIVGMVQRDAATVAGILGTIGLGLALLAAALAFGLIAKLTRDFVVPIMFLHGRRCWDAWREFSAVLSANFGRFALYVLFQLVLGFAIGILVLTVVIVTCCCAGCLMAIPYLGTVLLLPVLMFERAYSLHYLAQYGPAFDVFSVAGPATPGATRPGA